MWALVRQTLAPSQSRSRAHGPASEAGMWTFSMACSGSFSRRRARADVFASPCRFRAHILARFAFACPFSFCVCVLARRCSPAVSRSFSRARVRFCAGVLARTCSPARVALVSVFACPGSFLRRCSCADMLAGPCRTRFGFRVPGFVFAQAFLHGHACRPVSHLFRFSCARVRFCAGVLAVSRSFRFSHARVRLRRRSCADMLAGPCCARFRVHVLTRFALRVPVFVAKCTDHPQSVTRRPLQSLFAGQ